MFLQINIYADVWALLGRCFSSFRFLKKKISTYKPLAHQIYAVYNKVVDFGLAALQSEIVATLLVFINFTKLGSDQVQKECQSLRRIYKSEILHFW